MINQYQIRELLKNDDFKIYFKDIPFPTPEWNKKNNSSGLEDFEEKISKLTQPSNKLKIDILYRISFPYRMYGGNANKIFVFGTSEYQKIDNMIYQGEELNEKYINKSIKVITSSNWSKIGFIKEGQLATVRLASSDAINFGNIEGIVKKISPDANQDDQGNTYYKVEIKTQKTYFEYNEQKYHLTPGVEVSSSILTGERTIAEYLLNPLLNISNKAFRER